MSNEQIRHTIRKSELSAQNRYEYGQLVFPRDEFLQAAYEEEKEELTFIYEVEGVKPFSGIRAERRDTILVNLLDCAKLIECCQRYKIALQPDNLYYNIHNQVLVLDRDVYGRGEEFEEASFLKQYQALIGFALQEKYSYQDYFEGGMELLEKDKYLSGIAKETTVEGIKNCLLQEYERVTEEYRTTKILIDKHGYGRNKKLLTGASILLVLALALIGYEMLWVKPYKDAVVKANQKYLQIDYTGVIESMGKTKLSRLSVYDKYILAYSYIQCENLSEEQKKNIINALSLETNEKVLEYWVYLGRLDVKEAENIAQQVSDNDLLLYAYLKDKSMVEEDTKISGQEKEQRVEELSQKIEKLSGTYSSTEEADQDKENETTQETAAPTPQ